MVRRDGQDGEGCDGVLAGGEGEWGRRMTERFAVDYVDGGAGEGQTDKEQQGIEAGGKHDGSSSTSSAVGVGERTRYWDTWVFEVYNDGGVRGMTGRVI